MKVYVEGCYSNYPYFRVTYKNTRFRVSGFTWNKETASEALDIICQDYKLNRKNIVFIHL